MKQGMKCGIVVHVEFFKMFIRLYFYGYVYICFIFLNIFCGEGKYYQIGYLYMIYLFIRKLSR